jgi:hypothetical protein
LLVGRLGLSRRDALELSKVEYEAVVKHGLDKEKEDWKRTRWLAAVLVNISGKSVKKAVKDTDLLRFPDERKGNGFADFVKAAHDGERRK